jgi:biopolymer transport protein ExbB/TolQ
MGFRYLLVARFALINLVALAIAAAIYLQGWLDAMFVANIVELVLVIVAVFLYGLVQCGRKVWQTSVELNDLKSEAPPAESRAGKYLESVYRNRTHAHETSASALRAKLVNRIAVVRNVANSLVLLGLIGTVIGFIIALSSVDPNATAEADSIAPVIGRLINGMSVALYTTLVGSLLHVWLTVNHRLLASGTINLYAAIIDLGERRGRV